MNKTLGKVPLERALSKLGIASRAQTRRWILDGQLTVNGKTIINPTFLVIPEKDRFSVNGRPLRASRRRLVVFYKPKGVVTTRSDEKGRRTIFDFLSTELQQFHAVGRLDMATTGLLLLTNDTQLSNYLTDPKNRIVRTYVVTVEGKITEETIRLLTKGIRDQGELLRPAGIILQKTSGRESHLIVELTEGKNREIRRMFEAVNHDVTRLKRVAFGKLNIGDLKPGEFREVALEELGVNY